MRPAGADGEGEDANRCDTGLFAYQSPPTCKRHSFPHGFGAAAHFKKQGSRPIPAFNFRFVKQLLLFICFFKQILLFAIVKPTAKLYNSKVSIARLCGRAMQAWRTGSARHLQGYPAVRRAVAFPLFQIYRVIGKRSILLC